MSSYRVIQSTNYLAHHGILGQKWGILNGPPYPLGAEDHSASEKKAGWRKSLDKNDTSSDSSSKQSFKLTDSQKKLIKIGAAVALTGLAAYGVYKYSPELMEKFNQANNYSSPTPSYYNEADREKDLAKARELAEKEGIKIIPENERSQEESMRIINKDLELDEHLRDAMEKGAVNSLSKEDQSKILEQVRKGNLMNCMLCTNAAALRRQGYDVVAGKEVFGKMQTEPLDWWKGPKIVESLYGKSYTKNEINTFDLFDERNELVKQYRGQDKKVISELTKRISSYGEGSYGNLMVANMMNAHSVEFFVEKGKVKVFDYQLNRSYDSLDDFFKTTDHFVPALTQFMRLDNLIPDISAFTSDGQIAKRS